MIADRRRAGAVAAGVGLAGAVIVAIFVARPASDRPFPDADWTNGLAIGVSGAALAVSWLERGRGGPRLPNTLALTLKTAIVVLSLGVYVALGDVQFPYHRWDQFHYYIGAKYLPEIGYWRLYECAAVAEAERFGPAAVESRTIRDLATEAIVPAGTALADPDACKRHFTPARWAAFTDDVAWFRRDSPAASYWRRMQTDHGYNGSPAWSIAGRALASLAPASARAQTLLGLVDVPLLALAFGLIGWAFGAHAAWVSFIVWACQYPAKGVWTFGAFLRQDWFLAVVAALCLAKRARFAASGFALATATMLRLFPAVLLGVPVLVAARRWWRDGRIDAGDRRFALGFAVGATLWLVASTAAFGPAAVRAFAEHIAIHNAEPLGNHIGLHFALSQTIDGRAAVTMKTAAADPLQPWKAAREAAFAARRPIYLVLAALALALSAAAARRIRELWTALAASTLLVVVFLDVASYYCAFFVVLALLGVLDVKQEWLALGAIFVSRIVNALPLVADSADVRHAAQSVVFVAWAALALVLLLWSHPRSQPSAVDPAVRAA